MCEALGPPVRKSKIERLIEAMDRLSAALERQEQAQRGMVVRSDSQHPLVPRDWEHPR